MAKWLSELTGRCLTDSYLCSLQHNRPSGCQKMLQCTCTLTLQTLPTYCIVVFWQNVPCMTHKHFLHPFALRCSCTVCMCISFACPTWGPTPCCWTALCWGSDTDHSLGYLAVGNVQICTCRACCRLAGCSGIASISCGCRASEVQLIHAMPEHLLHLQQAYQVANHQIVENVDNGSCLVVYLHALLAGPSTCSCLSLAHGQCHTDK